MKCTVFIDESGEAGIKKIRSDGKPGSSPYLVLAASVMPTATQVHARKKLNEINEVIIKSWRHATDLNHSQTVYFARSTRVLNARYFAVVSKKSTLNEYSDEIEGDAHKFYNKCVQYLLESVGQYLKGKGLFDCDPNVIFEERNHDFDALRRFIGKCKDTPLHERAKFLQCFNPFGFTERSKEEEDLLKYADLAAHAVYQCVNKTKSNFGIPEPRYLVEMQSRFGADEKGRVLDYGIKCIHSIEQMELDADVADIWRGLKAKPRIPEKG